MALAAIRQKLHGTIQIPEHFQCLVLAIMFADSLVFQFVQICQSAHLEAITGRYFN
jgi:hypothetical protein